MLHKITYLLVFGMLVSNSIFAQEKVNWVKWEIAYELAKAENKIIFFIYNNIKLMKLLSIQNYNFYNKYNGNSETIKSFYKKTLLRQYQKYYICVMKLICKKCKVIQYNTIYYKFKDVNLLGIIFDKLDKI